MPVARKVWQPIVVRMLAALGLPADHPVDIGLPYRPVGYQSHVKAGMDVSQDGRESSCAKIMLILQIVGSMMAWLVKGSVMTMTDELVVRAALAKHETKLFHAIHHAWDEWRGLQLNGRLLFPGRSRACLVYDFIVQRAKAAFADEPSVRVIQRDETAKFVFDGQIALRFKKANENGLGSNIETQATMDFIDQQQELPGIPNAHKVEVVYILNHLQTQIDQVLVAARDGNACLWSYAIAPTGTQVVPLPLAPSAEPERGARIKLRAVEYGQKEETGGS